MQGQNKGNDCRRKKKHGPKRRRFSNKIKRKWKMKMQTQYTPVHVSPLFPPVIFPSLCLSHSFSAVFLDFVYHVNAMHLFFFSPYTFNFMFMSANGT